MDSSTARLSTAAAGTSGCGAPAASMVDSLLYELPFNNPSPLAGIRRLEEKEVFGVC
jgi:hypothetical protein